MTSIWQPCLNLFNCEQIEILVLDSNAWKYLTVWNQMVGWLGFMAYQPLLVI